MVSVAEEWRDVEGWSGYQISSLGQMRSIDRVVYSIKGPKRLKGRLLSSRPNNSGYLQTTVTNCGQKKRMLFRHHLVAKAFIGPRPGKCDVNHIDGNKLNNAVSNLEYVSHSENQHHTQRLFAQGLGPRLGTAKLSERAVREMRGLSKCGLRLAKLSRAYDICESNVSMILRRKTWKHV